MTRKMTKKKRRRRERRRERRDEKDGEIPMKKGRKTTGNTELNLFSITNNSSGLSLLLQILSKCAIK